MVVVLQAAIAGFSLDVMSSVRAYVAGGAYVVAVAEERGLLPQSLSAFG